MMGFETAIQALYSGNELAAAQHLQAYLATHPNDTLGHWYSTHLRKVGLLISKELGFLVPFRILR